MENCTLVFRRRHIKCFSCQINNSNGNAFLSKIGGVCICGPENVFCILCKKVGYINMTKVIIELTADVFLDHLKQKFTFRDI